jgi:hypothetical protein
MVIGCVLIGLGFGVPAIVYNKESLPMPIKVIIHMEIGCVVYTVVGYAIGWIGRKGRCGFLCIHFLQAPCCKLTRKYIE